MRRQTSAGGAVVEGVSVRAAVKQRWMGLSIDEELMHGPNGGLDPKAACHTCASSSGQDPPSGWRRRWTQRHLATADIPRSEHSQPPRAAHCTYSHTVLQCRPTPAPPQARSFPASRRTNVVRAQGFPGLYPPAAVPGKCCARVNSMFRGLQAGGGHRHRRCQGGALGALPLREPACACLHACKLSFCYLISCS